MDMKFSFCTAIEDAGLVPPVDVIADGQFHRFKSSKSSKNKNGYYALHNNGGHMVGIFGCWASGINGKWHSETLGYNALSNEALAFQKMFFDEQKLQQAAMKSERKEFAALLFEQAQDTPLDHGYIVNKKVVCAGGVRYHPNVRCADFFFDKTKSGYLKDVLLIPIYDNSKIIQSLQVINASGKKFFLKGGEMKGGRFTFEGKNETVYVCEGFATGSTIHHLTGSTVFVAFNASNMSNVVIDIKNTYPSSKIIIAADNDHVKEAENKGNKGLEVARQIHKEHHLGYSAPEFIDSELGSDWNDYYHLHGEKKTLQALVDNVIADTVKNTFDNFDNALQALQLDDSNYEAFNAAIHFIKDANTIVANRMRKQLSSVSGIGVCDIRKEVKDAIKAESPPDLTHHDIAEAYCKTLGLPYPVGEYGALWFYNNSKSVWESKSLSALSVYFAKHFGHEIRCQRENDYKAIASHTYNYLENPGYFKDVPQGLLTPEAFYLVQNKDLVSLPPGPEHRARFRLETNPAAEGKTPKLLLSMLNDAFYGQCPEEQIRQLRMFLGMSLFGLQNKEQRAVLLYGAAGSGKSLFLKIIEALVPNDYITNVSPVEMGNDYKVATLAGKMLNLVPEIERTVAVPSDKFKSIIGGDTMQAREPYGKAFSFIPMAANWFNGNFFLTTRDHSEGFWRRWAIVHFANTKPADERDPDLLHRIIDNELPEILRWAMDGVNDYLDNGLYLSPSHYACLDKWKNTGNSVACWLQDNEDNGVGERVNCASKQPLKVTVAYTIYKDWCQHNNRRPFNKQEFKEHMAVLGNPASIYQGYNCYTKLYEDLPSSKFFSVAC